MIIASGISFKYSRDYVLRNVNVSFDRGLHLIKGPNGSGKTTLCKIISGLLPPTRGEVYIDGVEIYRGEGGEEILKKVVYVHDRPIVLNRSVYENIIFGAEIRGINIDDIDELIAKFNLQDVLNKNANELSTGYKHLVSLLRAFASKPEYLILDEPLLNLDDEFKGKMLEFIVRYSKRYTVIIATHEPYLDDLAASITYLKNGYIRRTVRG